MEVNRHPLTIDVVVLEIMRHVSPSMKDLFVFRQVCRLWRQLATPIISSRSLKLPMMTFQSEGAEGNAEDSGADCTGCNPKYSLLPKYIDYLESDADPKIIFSYFHFHFISLDHPLVQRFLEGFGHTVKSLRLNQKGCNDTGWSHRYKCDRAEKVNPQTFRRLLLSCPNLEEIVFGRVDPEGGENGFLLPDDDFQTKIKRMALADIFIINSATRECRPQEKFISDMLKVCPFLERFLTDYVDEGFETIKALSQSPHLSALKELRIPYCCQDYIFLGLIQGEQEGKLKLRKLKFEDVRGADEPEEYHRFLNTQKSSLETLIVGDWKLNCFNEIGFNQLPRVQFPDGMKKLKVLKIANVEFDEEIDEEPDPIFRQLLFETLDFRRRFPVLQTLILEGDAERYDFNDLLAPGWEPQLVLEGLVLPSGIDYEDLGHMAELFPNVKYLKLRGVDEDVLDVLWVQWPQLESLLLDLRDQYVDIEAALTGLSSEQISLAQSLVENGEEINIPAENPSIVNFQNLKELRIFEIKEDSAILRHRPRAFLSDVSIHYSLSKLPNLEYFGVNLHKFTSEGINVLCNVRGLKWNKNEDCDWPLQCQKDMKFEYKLRPHCDEDFTDYEINRRGKYQEMEDIRRTGI